MIFRFLHLFKFTKHSNVVEALTLNDIFYWGGDAFISVILALFVTQYIEGATASSIGIAYMIYRLVSSITAVFAGKLFDSIKGYVDEMWALFAASMFSGITYILLSFADQIWHLYLAMAIVGICRSFDVNAWRMIFYSHLDPKTKGRTMGTYDAIFGITIGLIAALSGFVGDIYGFRSVILVAGVIISLGAIPVLSLKKEKTFQ